MSSEVRVRDAVDRIMRTWSLASDNHLELSKAARKFNKRNDRALARKLRCLVAVSKLDRLSRDLHFISGLMAHNALRRRRAGA